MIRRSKPLHRSTAPIPRKVRPRARLPKRLGSYRERVKYADRLWRELIRAKAPDGLCMACRKRPWHDAMHGFIKGRYGHLRFELDNGLMGCRPCHRHIDSDHHAKAELWTRHLGAEAYERLRLRAQSRAKADLDLTILFLERETAARNVGVA